jgi:hypothetical protein
MSQNKKNKSPLLKRVEKATATQLAYSREQHERELLREALPVALLDQLDKIEALRKNGHVSLIKTRYQLGAIIDEIYTDATEGGEKVYGANAIKNIAQVLAIDDGILSQAMNVFRCYAEDEIDVLAGLVRPDGSHLSYSHLAELTRLKEDDSRDQLLEQVIAECWTVQEVEDEVNDRRLVKFPGRQQRGKPRTLEAAIAYGKKSANELEKTLDRLSFDPGCSLSEHTKKVEEAEVTEEMVQSLYDLALHRRRIAEQADRVATQTEREYRSLKAALKQRAAATETSQEVSVPSDADAPNNTEVPSEAQQASTEEAGMAAE